MLTNAYLFIFLNGGVYFWRLISMLSQEEKQKFSELMCLNM